MGLEKLRRKIFVALDESSPYLVKQILEHFGYSFSPNFSDKSLLREFSILRKRILSSHAFSNEFIQGVILPYESAYEEINGIKLNEFLFQKGIRSFLKIDEGVMKEEHGIKIPSISLEELDLRLSFAHCSHYQGIKTRSLIYSSDAKGIKNAVKQQLIIARHSLMHELTPIIELEVDTHIADRKKAETRLFNELERKSDRLIKSGKIIYRFSFPETNGLYAPLLKKEPIEMLLASTSGYSKSEVLQKAKQNPELIPAFSRAFLDELRVNMNEREFSETLFRSIEEISQIE